jgi:signal transduction histidine kinase
VRPAALLRETTALGKVTAVKKTAAKPDSSKSTSAKKSAASKSVVKNVRAIAKPGLITKSAAAPSPGAPAGLLEEAERGLLRAGKMLHDEVAPLLVAAGLRLQLLRMDHPQAADQVSYVLATIDHAMERVRTLSQQLNPSPVYAIPARGRRLRPGEVVREGK